MDSWNHFTALRGKEVAADSYNCCLLPRKENAELIQTRADCHCRYDLVSCYKLPADRVFGVVLVCFAHHRRKLRLCDCNAQYVITRIQTDSQCCYRLIGMRRKQPQSLEVCWQRKQLLTATLKLVMVATLTTS